MQIGRMSDAIITGFQSGRGHPPEKAQRDRPADQIHSRELLALLS
jgi:hypothetical protein